MKTSAAAGDPTTPKPQAAADDAPGKPGVSGKAPALGEPVTDLYISRSASMRRGITLSDLTKISFTLSHEDDTGDSTTAGPNESQTKRRHRNWPGSRCTNFNLTGAECDNSTRSTQAVQSFSFELLASRGAFQGSPEDALMSITFERRHGNLADPCYITLSQKAGIDFSEMVVLKSSNRINFCYESRLSKPNRAPTTGGEEPERLEDDQQPVETF